MPLEVTNRWVISAISEFSFAACAHPSTYSARPSGGHEKSDSEGGGVHSQALARGGRAERIARAEQAWKEAMEIASTFKKLDPRRPSGSPRIKTSNISRRLIRCPRRPAGSLFVIYVTCERYGV